MLTKKVNIKDSNNSDFITVGDFVLLLKYMGSITYPIIVKIDLITSCTTSYPDVETYTSYNGTVIFEKNNKIIFSNSDKFIKLKTYKQYIDAYKKCNIFYDYYEKMINITDNFYRIAYGES
jgi:ribosomal protein S17